MLLFGGAFGLDFENGLGFDELAAEPNGVFFELEPFAAADAAKKEAIDFCAL